jgi:DNA-binding protein H-NS
MKTHDLESMSVDELSSLREFVALVLARKISAEKARLDERLRQLNLDGVPNHVEKMSRARRPYPQVFPKYRNPAEPSETWTGRGKQPRWLTAQLKSGKQLEDFRIQASSDRGAALRKVVTLINEKTSRGWSNIKKIGFLKRNQRIRRRKGAARTALFLSNRGPLAHFPFAFSPALRLSLDRAMTFVGEHGGYRLASRRGPFQPTSSDQPD